MHSLLLEEAILQTLFYFSLYEYPLTVMEIWQYLFCSQPYSLQEVENALSHSLRIKKMIQYKDGLYARIGQDHIRGVRMQRYRDAEKKFCKALFYTRIFSWVPWVRLVCIVNSLSYSNSQKKSDIDFFIIAGKKHLWFVRFVCTTLMHVLGKRPGQGSGDDALCLSFFIDDSNLCLSRFVLPLAEEIPDIHFAIWFTQFVPLYDQGGFYDKLYYENNWVEHILPNRIPYRTHERRRVSLSQIECWLKNCVEYIVSLCGWVPEKICRLVQKKFLPQSIRLRMNKDSCVVVEDSVFKIHLHDRRAEIRDEWRKQISHI